MLDAGAVVAAGSDWNVAPPVPLMGIYAAITRATLDGKKPAGWVPEERISVEEALRAYTSGAAHALFEENRLGRIQAGMLADFVLLDRDLTAVDPSSIKDASVLLCVCLFRPSLGCFLTRRCSTVMGGKPTYDKLA